MRIEMTYILERIKAALTKQVSKRKEFDTALLLPPQLGVVQMRLHTPSELLRLSELLFLS